MMGILTPQLDESKEMTMDEILNEIFEKFLSD